MLHRHIFQVSPVVNLPNGNCCSSRCCQNRSRSGRKISVRAWPKNKAQSQCDRQNSDQNSVVHAHFRPCPCVVDTSRMNFVVTVATTSAGRSPAASAPSGGVPRCEPKSDIANNPATKMAPATALRVSQRSKVCRSSNDIPLRQARMGAFAHCSLRCDECSNNTGPSTVSLALAFIGMRADFGNGDMSFFLHPAFVNPLSPQIERGHSQTQRARQN